MDLKIKGRLALVTGASRNIGRAIATELAHEGACVIMVARSSDQLESLRQEMPNPKQHHVIGLDLMLKENVEALVREIQGIGSLDIVVHNLGGPLDVKSSFVSSEDFLRIWHYNFGIGHEINRIFIPRMVQRKWGRIVHLSTLATRTYKASAAYVSAKCALDGYIKCVSREIAKDNVIMTAVAPSIVYKEGRFWAKLEKENPSALQDYFKNNLLIGRLATCEEIGRVAAFLCSEQASYMAGSIVGVDGGGM